MMKYCAIINWGLTPYCNFNCFYCNAKYSIYPFINFLQSNRLGRYFIHKKQEKIGSIAQSKKYRCTINIPKMMAMLGQFGKPVKVRLLGGEPFLVPYFIELAEALTRQHYIDVETNLSTNTVKKFCERINPLQVDKIRAAFHIEEYEKRNMVGRYLDNALCCKEKGFNIECFAIAYPPLIEKFLMYKDLFAGSGVLLKAQPFVGHYRGASYPRAYTKKKVQALQLEPAKFHNFENTKGRLCTAGKSFFVVSTIWPGRGEVEPCYQIKRPLGTIENGFIIQEHLTVCPYNKCYCDPKFFEREFFDAEIKAHADFTRKSETLKKETSR